MAISKLCSKCVNKCKQPDYTNIISCPHFIKQPKQLEFKLEQK